MRVQGSAGNPTFAQGLKQSCFSYQWSTGGVQNKSSSGHCAKFPFTNHPFSGLGKWRRQDQKIQIGQELELLSSEEDAVRKDTFRITYTGDMIRIRATADSVA
jgi:hypothetical protein